MRRLDCVKLLCFKATVGKTNVSNELEDKNIFSGSFDGCKLLTVSVMLERDGLHAGRNIQALGVIFFLCQAGKYKTVGLFRNVC